MKVFGTDKNGNLKAIVYIKEPKNKKYEL